MSTYNDLTDQQLKNFEHSLRQAGIDRASVPKSVVIDGECRIAGDPARSYLKPHRVVLRDVAHMKELGGVANSLFTEGGASDSHIPYPPPLSPERQRVLAAAAKDTDSLYAAMTDDERRAVGDALRSYVVGNSEKVPDYYVTLVNAASFPQEGNVVAAENVTIKDRTVFAGTEPQKLIAGTLTIVKPNGQIVAECPLTIDAQFVVVQNA